VKYYGANVFDFTPNLSVDNAGLLVWGFNVQVARVYAHKVYCYRKDSPTVNKTGWSNPNMSVPAWYTSLDPDYSSPTFYSASRIGVDSSYNYNYQTQFVFDTAFLGSQAVVAQALMTIYGKQKIPYQYTFCGTPVYCNFYASEAAYIHTYLKGQPINVANSGSGYAARFGPYPTIPSSEFRRRVYPLQDISADTVPLDVAAVNKTGLTKLTGLASSCLTLTNPGFFFYECMMAAITVYYVSA
jgi:hypothetical protein